jgi:hypothetical protein
MTKPVAVFRSGVIGDSRHTVRLDENSHLVLFPSFSRHITSWVISATWPVVKPLKQQDLLCWAAHATSRQTVTRDLMKRRDQRLEESRRACK